MNCTAEHDDVSHNKELTFILYKLMLQDYDN